MQILTILSEYDLIQRFGLQEGKERSRTVSSWISKGLQFIEISGQRFFRDKDVVEFFNKLHLEKYGSVS